jgi:hypothetical protein
MLTASSTTKRHLKPAKLFGTHHHQSSSKPATIEQERPRNDEDGFGCETSSENEIVAKDDLSWHNQPLLETPSKSVIMKDEHSLQPIEHDFDDANSKSSHDDDLTEELFRQASEKLLDPPSKVNRDVWHIIPSNEDPTEEIDGFWEDSGKHSWDKDESACKPWGEGDADELDEQRVSALWPSFNSVFRAELDRLTTGGASTRALERLERLHMLAAAGSAQVAIIYNIYTMFIIILYAYAMLSL